MAAKTLLRGKGRAAARSDLATRVDLKPVCVTWPLAYFLWWLGAAIGAGFVTGAAVFTSAAAAEDNTNSLLLVSTLTQ